MTSDLGFATGSFLRRARYTAGHLRVPVAITFDRIQVNVNEAPHVISLDFPRIDQLADRIGVTAEKLRDLQDRFALPKNGREPLDRRRCRPGYLLGIGPEPHAL